MKIFALILAAIIGLTLVLIFVGLIWFGIIAACLLLTVATRNKKDECPRVQAGYQCRGKSCNHSPDVREQIRRAT